MMTTCLVVTYCVIELYMATQRVMVCRNVQQPSKFICFVTFIVIFNIPVSLGMGHISEVAYGHQDIQSHLTLAFQNANTSNYNPAWGLTKQSRNSSYNCTSAESHLLLKLYLPQHSQRTPNCTIFTKYWRALVRLAPLSSFKNVSI